MARVCPSRANPFGAVLAGIIAVLAGLLLKPLLVQAGEPWWVLLVVVVAGISAGVSMLFTRRLPSSPVFSPQLLEATAQQFPRIRQLRRLLRFVTRAIVRYTKARHATVFLQDPRNASLYWLLERYGHALPTVVQQLDETSPLVQWLLEFRKPLVYQEVAPSHQPNGYPSHEPNRYARVYLILENLRSELVIPTFRGKRLLGFLALGEKPKEKPYTEEELSTLSRLSREWAVAVDNARRFEEWQATTHKLQSAQGRLLQQERMVAAGKLAMGLAHEIKNPLAGIKTFTEYLPEKYHDPQFRQDFFESVSREVDRINRIVCSLADFAKPILLKIETMDVQKVLQETATFLTNDCLKKNVKLESSFEPQPILMPGDAAQLKQACLNLCLNALEAMDKGGTLSVSCLWDNGEAVLRIADTGCGIAKDHLPQLFDPFFSTKQSGMGLGLAVVKQIVEQHLGSIKVDSEVGVGTTFEIRVPLAVRFRHLKASAQPAETQAAIKLATPLDVLVVDDEPKMRTMLKDAFEAMGAQVRTAESGEEAVRLVAKAVPQLILLDLKLPVMDGFEVLKHVKLRYPQLVVIVISGYYDESIDRFVKELGAVAYFHKPLDLPVLQRKVAEIAAQLAPQPA